MPPSSAPPPMEHQVKGREWLADKPRALLGDDPGLGKTRQLLEAAKGQTLVIGPAMLEGVWDDECELWDTDMESYRFLSYSKVPRRPEILRQHWDTVILDEAHNVKNRKAQRTEVILKLARGSDRVWLATGTPIPNWAHELYIPLRLLHEPNDRRYTSYWRWVGNWFEQIKTPWGVTKIGDLLESHTWEEFAQENDLGTLYLARKRDDVLDLPPVTETTIELEMTPAQKKAYQQLKKDFYTMVEETGTEVLALHSGSLFVQLLKATTGLCTLDPTVTKPESNKLAALRELLEDRVGQATVIFCWFRDTADWIVKTCQYMGRKVDVIKGGMSQATRDATRRAFQSGHIDTVVGTLATVGEGLTLTKADSAIFVERSWRPSMNEQAMRRIHRIGQERPVTITHLMTTPGLDRFQTKKLVKKTDQQVKALTAADILREI